MFGYYFYCYLSMLFIGLWSGVVKSSEDYNESFQLQEKTILIPKRAALLLDRIMIALQKALDEDEKADNTIMDHKNSLFYLNHPSSVNIVTAKGRAAFKNTEDNNIIPATRGMMLYRRATDKYGVSKGGYNVWQCYFNVITCFRRKK